MGEVVFLDVPYHEKDEAKRLGARWDPEVRKWYIPEGRQHEPFSRWLPEISDDIVLQVSAPIYVVESSSSCWSCGRISCDACARRLPNTPMQRPLCGAAELIRRRASCWSNS